MNRGRDGGAVFLRLMRNNSKLLKSRWHDFRKAKKKIKKSKRESSGLHQINKGGNYIALQSAVLPLTLIFHVLPAVTLSLNP